MTPAPLGVLDLYPNLPPAPMDTDHWYWCRRHGQAAGVTAKCKASHSPPSYKVDEFWDAADHMVGTTWEMDYPLNTCIRIGPFMTEREANRLGGLDRHNKPGDHAVDCWGSPMTPLGMEIEQ